MSLYPVILFFRHATFSPVIRRFPHLIYDAGTSFSVTLQNSHLFTMFFSLFQNHRGDKRYRHNDKPERCSFAFFELTDRKIETLFHRPCKSLHYYMQVGYSKPTLIGYYI
jgi:hypothetical protein